TRPKPPFRNFADTPGFLKGGLSRRSRRGMNRSIEAEARTGMKYKAPLRWIAVWGPGLLVMLADTDAGNVVTAAQAGARWGYRLLPLLLALTPLLYVVQELTVRLALHTGRGHGE